jgi:hypothetical protein
LKLDSVFSRQFDEKRQFGLSFLEFFRASRKETIKPARHAHDDHCEVLVPQRSWGMRNSFGKINNVTLSPTEQLSANVDFDFTGFYEKGFVGRAMKVRWRNIGRRSGNPQYAKGVPSFFGTYQNMGFLPKRPYHTALAGTDRAGWNILNHCVTRPVLPSRGSLTQTKDVFKTELSRTDPRSPSFPLVPRIVIVLVIVLVIDL